MRNNNVTVILSRALGIGFITLFSTIGAYAATHNAPDTGKKQLLASLDKKNDRSFIVLEPNVLYPALLAGNEKQSLEYIEKFADRKRDYLIRMYTKGKKFFPKTVSILKKYNVPGELKVLLALESAFNGNAVSKAGAVGYWQFMDEAAKEYGLNIAPKVAVVAKIKTGKKDRTSKGKTNKAALVKDDRKNFNRSTTAAARYLKDRNRNLDGDWLLIVASYNCGIGNVWNAMENCGKKDPDFWDVKDYLPTETRTYVMNFIALNVIFNNYDAFLNNSLRFQPVKIKASALSNAGEQDAVFSEK